MIKKLSKLLLFSILTSIFSTNFVLAQTCSDAGTATAAADSVCYIDTTNLSVTGYIGAIQWQGSIDNITFVDETGTGSTTDSYDVNPQETTYYRAIVTDTGCLPDTGNVVTLTVGVINVPTAANVSRCGPGQVSLNGTGSGVLHWYSDSIGGYPFATGNSASEYFPASTTVYVENNTPGGGDSPIQITEINPDPDILEIQNVSNQPLDVTGWKVAINDSYTDINVVNNDVQILSGIMQPGDILTWVDLTTAPNYWGSNMLWNSGGPPAFTAWVLILDDQNNVRDFVPLNWSDAIIQSMSVNINGTIVTPGSIWSGDGPLQNLTAGPSNQRTGIQDNDIASDFIVAPISTGLTDVTMTLPFLGFGCSSPRVLVQVTISTSDSISISPTLPAICLGETSALTVSSINANYTYTWSPATGLDTTGGPVVQASPIVTTTYVVVGDDGTCANVDTIEISVGTPSLAGSAITYQDTVCLGNSTDLILQGSNGVVQWQSFNGTNWINETGAGFDSTTYKITPAVDMMYRSVVTSGGCPSDTSITLDIAVLTIIEPILTDTTLCGGGNVSLTAIGVGNINWHDDSTSTTAFFTGPTYAYNATATDTFWVAAFSGSDYVIGPATTGIGNQTNGTSNDLGMAFDVVAACTIESVKVFPQTSGQITINLRQIQNGPILATFTTSVISFLGQDIPINFAVSPGTNYRLELAAGSVACNRNTSGAIYPYQVANGPLEIIGYYSPNFGNFGAYYWFYNWRVSDGCKSDKVPVIVTVNPLPPNPTIGQLGNTLISSSTTGNQWLLNGTIIPGATGQSLNITQIGTYTVAVTINGCTSLSPPFPVVTISINELDGVSLSTFPNPVSNLLNIHSNKPITFDGTINVIDLQGREVITQIGLRTGQIINEKIDVSKLSPGVYFLDVNGTKGTSKIRFQVNR